MGKLKRPNIASILAFSVLAQVLVTTAGAAEIPPAAEEMAKTYGLDSWDQIEAIHYTSQRVEISLECKVARRLGMGTENRQDHL